MAQKLKHWNLELELNYSNMRAIIYFLCLLLMFGCDSASECFQSSGDMVTKELSADIFTMINVGEGIELVVKQGDERSITVSTGENLLSNITATVSNGELFLKNESGCNWSRTYNNTTIVVTTPELTKIYSSTQFAVRSEGVLNFPVLSLQSAMFNKTASGTFELNVNCGVLSIEDNASSFFNLRGSTNDLTVNFYDGNARFEGSELSAQNVYTFQRSSNDIVVAPQQSISGTIYSTGNVILMNVPAVVNVVQLYTGHLIYP